MNKRGFKIGICGAGIAGICTAIQLQLQLNIKDFVIFEEHKELGGTWFLNTYPNCASDVPTYFYSFSFEENPNWSQFYASQEEILEYLKNVARKHDITKNIKFEHKVKCLSWDEKTLDWKVVVESAGTRTTFVFDLIFSCMGGLNIPSYPEQFEAFKGLKMHTARWDHNVKLDGKRVAVVGTGASAIQIIPAIVDKVESLIVYQRTPPWVFPRLQFFIPTWIKWVFNKLPVLQKGARFALFWIFVIVHRAFVKESIMGKIMKLLGKFTIWKEFNKGDETLKREMVPKYPVGLKRLMLSDNYYKALNKSNVKIQTKEILKVNNSSIVTEDGEKEQIDVLIMATGFRVLDYGPEDLIIYGINGVDIFNMIKTQGPTAYHGACTFHLPNFFFMIGPNGTTITSYFFTIECVTNYVMKVIQEMIVRNSSVVVVKEEEEKLHMKEILTDMEKMIWSYDFSTYYKDKRGVVIALNPNSPNTFWKNSLAPNFNHFYFK